MIQGKPVKRPRYLAYDLIMLEGKDFRGLSYEHRLGALQQQIIRSDGNFDIVFGPFGRWCGVVHWGPGMVGVESMVGGESVVGWDVWCGNFDIVLDRSAFRDPVSGFQARSPHTPSDMLY